MAIILRFFTLMCLITRAANYEVGEEARPLELRAPDVLHNRSVLLNPPLRTSKKFEQPVLFEPKQEIRISRSTVQISVIHDLTDIDKGIVVTQNYSDQLRQAVLSYYMQINGTTRSSPFDHIPIELINEIDTQDKILKGLKQEYLELVDRVNLQGTSSIGDELFASEQHRMTLMERMNELFPTQIQDTFTPCEIEIRECPFMTCIDYKENMEKVFWEPCYERFHMCIMKIYTKALGEFLQRHPIEWISKEHRRRAYIQGTHAIYNQYNKVIPAVVKQPFRYPGYRVDMLTDPCFKEYTFPKTQMDAFGRTRCSNQTHMKTGQYFRKQLSDEFAECNKIRFLRSAWVQTKHNLNYSNEIIQTHRAMVVNMGYPPVRTPKRSYKLNIRYDRQAMGRSAVIRYLTPCDLIITYATPPTLPRDDPRNEWPPEMWVENGEVKFPQPAERYANCLQTITRKLGHRLKSNVTQIKQDCYQLVQRKSRQEFPATLFNNSDFWFNTFKENVALAFSRCMVDNAYLGSPHYMWHYLATTLIVDNEYSIIDERLENRYGALRGRITQNPARKRAWETRNLDHSDQTTLVFYATEVPKIMPKRTKREAMTEMREILHQQPLQPEAQELWNSPHPDSLGRPLYPREILRAYELLRRLCRMKDPWTLARFGTVCESEFGVIGENAHIVLRRHKRGAPAVFAAVAGAGAVGVAGLWAIFTGSAITQLRQRMRVIDSRVMENRNEIIGNYNAIGVNRLAIGETTRLAQKIDIRSLQNQAHIQQLNIQRNSDNARLAYIKQLEARARVLATNVQEVQAAVVDVKDWVNMFSSRTVHPGAVTPPRLRELLRIAKKEVQQYKRLALPIDPEDPLYDYYEYITMIPTMIDHYFMLVLTIPLTDLSTEYVVYKVYNMPATHPELKINFEYEIESDYLAVNGKNTHFMLPINDEIKLCHVSRGRWCRLSTAMYPVNSVNWCIASLFKNNRTLIDENCKVKVQRQVGNLVRNLDKGVWAISSLEPHELFVRCVKTNSFVQIRPPLQIVHLGNGCEAYSAKFFIPPTNSIVKEETKELATTNRFVGLTDTFLPLTEMAAYAPFELKNLTQEELDKTVTKLTDVSTIPMHSMVKELTQLDQSVYDDPYKKFKVFIIVAATLGTIIIICIVTACFLTKREKYKLVRKGLRRAVGSTTRRTSQRIGKRFRRAKYKAARDGAEATVDIEQPPPVTPRRIQTSTSVGHVQETPDIDSDQTRLDRTDVKGRIRIKLVECEDILRTHDAIVERIKVLEAEAAQTGDRSNLKIIGDLRREQRLLTSKLKVKREQLNDLRSSAISSTSED